MSDNPSGSNSMLAISRTAALAAGLGIRWIQKVSVSVLRSFVHLGAAKRATARPLISSNSLDSDEVDDLC